MVLSKGVLWVFARVEVFSGYSSNKMFGSTQGYLLQSKEMWQVLGPWQRVLKDLFFRALSFM